MTPSDGGVGHTPGPWAVVEMAFKYADALMVAERAAERLWKNLPGDRRPAFDAADTDFSLTQKEIRALADAWQGELDRTGG